MKYKYLTLMAAGSVFFITGCSDSSEQVTGKPVTSVQQKKQIPPTRWYNAQQVKSGDVLYQKHCATCHQADASGTGDWRQLDVNGKYPPPPLNGSAHTWHHHLEGLKRTIRIGGVSLGGSMPGFANKLNNQEIEAVLAWVQSQWSDEIYAAWNTRNEQASK